MITTKFIGVLFSAFYIMSSSLTAVASTGATLDSKITPLKLTQVVSSLKHYKDFDEAVKTTDLLLPTLGLNEWIKYFNQQNVDLKKFTFESVRAEGNNMYFEGFPKPFVFGNDRKTVTYGGIDFKFDPQQTPAETMKRMKSAWGQFKEFSAPASAASGKIGLLMNTANAAETKAGKAIDILAPLAGIGVAVVIAIGLMGITLTLAGVAATAGAVAAVGAAGYVFITRSINSENASFLTDVELRCEPAPPAFVKPGAYEGHARVLENVTNEVTFALGIREPADIGAMLKGMAETCKSKDKTQALNTFLQSWKTPAKDKRSSVVAPGNTSVKGSQ